MIETKKWRGNLISELEELLLSDPNVLALVVFGSYVCKDNFVDIWSDLDCLIVVRDRAGDDYFPGIVWLESFGTIIAYDQSSNNAYNTSRICFSDLRRLDLIICTATSLKNIEEWPRNPLNRIYSIIFSRKSWVDVYLSLEIAFPKYNQISNDVFSELVNSFWYKGVLSVYKVARNDLLIALHLALDLVRDCCVLRMMIRDRETGDTFHKDSPTGNEFVDRLKSAQQPYTASGIFNIIEECSVVFDQLASEWVDDYSESRFPLLEMIKMARETNERVP